MKKKNPLPELDIANGNSSKNTHLLYFYIVYLDKIKAFLDSLFSNLLDNLIRKFFLSLSL